MDACYYPKARLILRPDVSGASFWSVSLDKTMLTYFEVAPQTRFERHRHDSEQITMVLEGELVFELDQGSIRVGKGEVIAVPSNVPHAVYAGSDGAKAVDYWSPVPMKYVG
jgi:quercetin dioxygenase-like cupin family protein